MNARFAEWYYVIDDAEYQKIHLSRDKIVKAKEEKKPEEKASDASAAAGRARIPSAISRISKWTHRVHRRRWCGQRIEPDKPGTVRDGSRGPGDSGATEPRRRNGLQETRPSGLTGQETRPTNRRRITVGRRYRFGPIDSFASGSAIGHMLDRTALARSGPPYGRK